MIERDQPAIWRGPIVMKIITQFLRDVAWGQLDYFFVDMPPGTGDAQLSLVQATQVDGAIIVTTPQEVSVGDALRGAKMFQRVDVPVLGIVENMSWFECPHCGKPSRDVRHRRRRAAREELDLPLLGQVPLYPRVMEGGDTGAPIVVADAGSSAARALGAIAEQSRDRLRDGAGAAPDGAERRRFRRSLPLEPHEGWRPSRSRRMGGDPPRHRSAPARRSPRVALPAVASSLLMTLFSPSTRSGSARGSAPTGSPRCRRRCSGSG